MNYEKMTTSELLNEFLDYNDDIIVKYNEQLRKESSRWYFHAIPIELLAELIRRAR